MFNRREFIRGLGVGVATIAVPSVPALASASFKRPPVPLIDPPKHDPEVQRKLDYLNRLIDIATPMLHSGSPIRHHNTFIQLQQGELARCPRGEGVAYVYTQRSNPDLIVEGDTVCVPTFEISHIGRSSYLRRWEQRPAIDPEDLQYSAKQIVDDLIRQERVALDTMPYKTARHDKHIWQVKEKWAFSRADLTLLFFDQPDGSPGLLAYEDFGLCRTMGPYVEENEVDTKFVQPAPTLCEEGGNPRNGIRRNPFSNNRLPDDYPKIEYRHGHCPRRTRSTPAGLYPVASAQRRAVGGTRQTLQHCGYCDRDVNTTNVCPICCSGDELTPIT